jgi:hypothetical protein
MNRMAHRINLEAMEHSDVELTGTRFTATSRHITGIAA